MNVVPTNRLLLVLAVVLLPCGLVAAVAPEWTGYALLVGIVCLVGVALDGVISRSRLRAVKVRLPSVLRFVKGKSASFDLEVERARSAVRDLRIGLVAPAGVGADEETRATLTDEAVRFRVPWSVNPTERGSYRLTTAVVETPSAAALWTLRESKPIDSEIRVYPNLMSDKKTAASVLLTRGKGAHPLRQVGKGREFEKLREYMAGDTFNDIHWRATARHGRPVTKVFQVERTQEVYVVLDCSRLSGRTVGSEPALEQYLTASLLLGLAIQNDGDLFGVIAFDDKVKTVIRAGAGRAHFGTCRDALFALKPRRVAPDYRELSQLLRTRLRKRSLLMILSDLDDAAIAEEFETNMAVVRGRHLVVANMLRPTGVAPVFEGAPVESSDEVFNRLAGHLRWHTLEQTRRRLATRGISLSLLRPDNPAADLVARYRQIKGRQLL
jgi:uncharacterized protein (DUF58 family)